MKYCLGNFNNMKRITLLIAFIAGILTTGSVLACSPPSPPDLPDPASAVLAEMVKAKGDVQKFIAAGDEYLACEKNTAKYNSMVDKMQKVGEDFNKRIRKFKELKSK
jgi:hypothetical protein